MEIFAAVLFLSFLRAPYLAARIRKLETRNYNSCCPCKALTSAHSPGSISFTPYKQRVQGLRFSPQFGPYFYGTNFHLPESADMITMHAS
jgi:hypothetical protein